LNRLLRAQTLTVTFNKPFELLAETTVNARSADRFSFCKTTVILSGLGVQGVPRFVNREITRPFGGSLTVI
jgi:hypothetical protein